MALKGEYITRDGIYLSDSYVKIVQINLNNIKKEGSICLDIWESLKDKEQGEEAIDSLSYRVVAEISKKKDKRKYIEYEKVFSLDHLDLVNPMMQAYTVVKTRPELKNLLDV